MERDVTLNWSHLVRSPEKVHHCCISLTHPVTSALPLSALASDSELGFYLATYCLDWIWGVGGAGGSKGIKLGVKNC